MDKQYLISRYKNSNLKINDLKNINGLSDSKLNLTPIDNSWQDCSKELGINKYDRIFNNLYSNIPDKFGNYYRIQDPRHTMYCINEAKQYFTVEMLTERFDQLVDWNMFSQDIIEFNNLLKHNSINIIYYGLQSVIDFIYNLFILNTIKGITSEQKIGFALKNKIKKGWILKHSNKNNDYFFGIDYIATKNSKNVGIQIKPLSFKKTTNNIKLSNLKRSISAINNGIVDTIIYVIIDNKKNEIIEIIKNIDFTKSPMELIYSI